MDKNTVKKLVKALKEPTEYKTKTVDGITYYKIKGKWVTSAFNVLMLNIEKQVIQELKKRDT